MICVFLIETSQIEVPAKYQCAFRAQKFGYESLHGMHPGQNTNKANLLYICNSDIRADIHCFAHSFA